MTVDRRIELVQTCALALRCGFDATDAALVMSELFECSPRTARALAHEGAVVWRSQLTRAAATGNPLEPLLPSAGPEIADLIRRARSIAARAA
jgi:hypothetical protein